MILLTNDDGIEAAGLEAVAAFFEGCGENVCVVAPMSAMSECGHAVTTGRPLRVEERGVGRYAVDGTPADCVRVAVSVLMEERPRWVVSGMNHGANMGVDVYVSGTAAAAREAALGGLPALAISQYLRGKTDFGDEWHRRQLGRVWDRVLGESLAAGAFWNVNLPWPDESGEAPEVVFCEASKRPLPVAYEEDGDGAYRYTGVFHDRDREPGSDVERCFGGAITVSRIGV